MQFTQIPNNIIELLILPSLTDREKKVVLLVTRLTFGCQQRWVSLRNCDLDVINLGPTHASYVFKNLLAAKIIIQNQRNKAYRVNENLVASKVTSRGNLSLIRLRQLIGKQLDALGTPKTQNAQKISQPRKLPPMVTFPKNLVASKVTSGGNISTLPKQSFEVSEQANPKSENSIYNSISQERETLGSVNTAPQRLTTETVKRRSGDFSWEKRLAVLKQETSIIGIAARLFAGTFSLPGRITKIRCFSGEHDDRNASCLLLPDVNRYECKSCGAKGDVIDLVKAVQKISFKSAVEFLSPDFYKLGAGSQVVPEKYLESRGIKAETAEKFGLKILRDRVVIPIPTGEKYRFFVGRNKYGYKKGSTSCLFQTVSEGDPVFLCEGEFDAMLLWQETGYAAWSGTSGARTFKSDWVKEFEGVRRIFIVYDTDPQGREGAIEAAKHLGLSRCFNVLLPDLTKDITEYFQSGYTRDDFDILLRDAKPFDFQRTLDTNSNLEKMMVHTDFRTY